MVLDKGAYYPFSCSRIYAEMMMVEAMEDVKKAMSAKGFEICRQSRKGGTVGKRTANNNGRAGKDRK